MGLICSACDGIGGVLEFAIHFGIPFQLGIKLNDVHLFRSEKLTPMAREVAGAIYSPGFEEPILEYKGGGASLYKSYLAGISAVLNRPDHQRRDSSPPS